MTDEEILANAPDGATHFDGNTYFRFEMYEHGQAYLVLKNGTWDRGLPAYPVYSCRSLSDIRRIVELEEEAYRLRKRNNDMGAEYSSLERHYKRIAEDEKHRAEAAERERDELKRKLPESLRLFTNALLRKFSDRTDIPKHQICAFSAKRTEQLRQQLNGGE